MEAQCKRFEVRATDGGKVLFSADEDEIVIGADRLKVTGMVIIKFLNGGKHIFSSTLISLVVVFNIFIVFNIFSSNSSSI